MPRTYQLPYPATTAPDGGLVTLPELTPVEHSVAVLGCPWTEAEQVAQIQLLRGSSGAHIPALLAAALTRLAMATLPPGTAR